MTPDEMLVEALYTATGTTQRPGGQHAGSPHMFIRVTHVPTGLSAQCGEMRSQHKNKEVATLMVQYGLAEIGWKP